MPIDDTRGRPLRELRISVTDRCNFRCTYCMPREIFGAGYAFVPASELLSFEEISRVAKIFHGLGVRKIRLTGGEPLVRRDLPVLVQQLAGIGFDDLALTTNGSMLRSLAGPLRAAGLRRITVSLDALDDPTFHKMTDARLPVASVLDGIEAALAVGFTPVKINVVVRRGWNDHAIEPLIAHFDTPEISLRFIEYMDVGNVNGWQLDEVVSGSEIIERIRQVVPLEPLEQTHRGEVAQRYRNMRTGGEIGVITSVTAPFCADCTRARLSSEGEIYLCLFAGTGFPLKPLLRGGATDDEIAANIARIWRRRDDRYSELRRDLAPVPHKVEMSHIGG
jgi:cyclic pyranopterin phosphate synthase